MTMTRHIPANTVIRSPEGYVLLKTVRRVDCSPGQPLRASDFTLPDGGVPYGAIGPGVMAAIFCAATEANK